MERRKKKKTELKEVLLDGGGPGGSTGGGGAKGKGHVEVRSSGLSWAGGGGSCWTSSSKSRRSDALPMLNKAKLQ